MKKSLSVLLCLLLCLSIFAGCTPEEKPETEGSVEISGVWKFAKSVNKWEHTQKTLFKIQEKRATAVSFTANGQSFSSMFWDFEAYFASGATLKTLTFDGTPVYHSSTAGIPFVCDDWASQNYTTVDFGTEPQTVSKDFYNWLTANASPIT